MKSNDEIQIKLQKEVENNDKINRIPTYEELETRNRDLESAVMKVTRQITMIKDATAFALNTLNEAEQILARIQTPVTWKDISAKSMLTASLGIAAWFHGRDVFAEGLHFCCT